MGINETRLVTPLFMMGLLALKVMICYVLIEMEMEGCVYMYIDAINYENHSDLVPTDLEAGCVEIKQANTQSIMVSTIYRLPCPPSVCKN